jgi:plastocyanin
MGKRVAVIIVAVLIIGGIVFGLTRNKNSNYNSQANPPAASQNTQANNPSNSAQTNANTPTSTDSVTIQNFAFSPSDITVKKGTTVTWTNQDSTTHTVTEMDSQTGPSSDNLNPGAKYTFTFTQTGTFKYHCSIHPEMLGTVTVTD